MNEYYRPKLDAYLIIVLNYQSYPKCVVHCLFNNQRVLVLFYKLINHLLLLDHHCFFTGRSLYKLQREFPLHITYK